ncbi:MAG: HD domain-containing phosphohydrolase [Candidatus Aminicenantaceae bacterium]
MRKIKEFILSHFEGTLLLLVLLGIAVIAFLVHYKFAFLNFFYLPVILSAYFLGKRKAVLIAIFCVVLVIAYLLIFNLLIGQETTLSFDEIVNITTWGCFLIISGAVIGSVSDQRVSHLKNLRRAYIGGLEIMLKYLEVADDSSPRSIRVSLIASKIAQRMGLNTSDVENVKTASLLYEAGDLGSSLPFYEEIADFMETDAIISKTQIRDREQVMLKTTAFLLKEIRPILSAYYHHYVEKGHQLDKDLENIPVGSSIIAVADAYDKLKYKTSPSQRIGNIRSIEDIENLSGRTFHISVVEALKKIDAQENNGKELIH